MSGDEPILDDTMREFLPDADMVLLASVLFSLGVYFGISLTTTVASESWILESPEWVHTAAQLQWAMLGVAVAGIAGLLALGYRAGAFSEGNNE